MAEETEEIIRVVLDFEKGEGGRGETEEDIMEGERRGRGRKRERLIGGRGRRGF